MYFVDKACSVDKVSGAWKMSIKNSGDETLPFIHIPYFYHFVGNILYYNLYATYIYINLRTLEWICMNKIYYIDILR